MFPGLALISCGKTYSHRNDCHKGGSLYSQIPRNMKDATLYRATQANTRVGQEAKEAGETLCKNCVVVSIGEA